MPCTTVHGRCTISEAVRRQVRKKERKKKEKRKKEKKQGFISKADGIKALMYHIEESRSGRMSMFRFEKRICNCRASLQKTDIIQIFTVGRVVYLGRFTGHLSTVWRPTVMHSTEL